VKYRRDISQTYTPGEGLYIYIYIYIYNVYMYVYVCILYIYIRDCAALRIKLPMSGDGSMGGDRVGTTHNNR